MKAVILAGGKGERLRPITNTIPKPMVKVGGKPVIEYTIRLLKKYKITDITLTLCYLPEAVKKYFGNGKKFGVNTSYIVEKEDQALGTAGALALLKEGLNETFIVCSGDTLRSCDINDILNFHKKNRATATICVYDNRRPDPKSFVIFDKGGRITKFVERPKKLPQGKIWSNAYFFVFEPETLDLIPENTPSDFGKDILPKLVNLGKKVFAYKGKGYFLDVGTLEKMKTAEEDIKRARLKI